MDPCITADLIMGSLMQSYTQMPQQLGWAINFSEPTEGGRGAQLRPKITLMIALKCSPSN